MPSNDFTGDFEPPPPSLPAKIPPLDDNFIDDDPRDVETSITIDSRPDTPIKGPPGSFEADLAAAGQDTIPPIPADTLAIPSIETTDLPDLDRFAQVPVDPPLQPDRLGVSIDVRPVGDVSGAQEGLDTPVEAIGRYEAFLARVRSVHYVKANGHPVARMKQAIDFERVWTWYDTNNDPTAGPVGPTHSRPVSSVNYAVPFPVRHDQEAYHVKRGDLVTVIQGEDRAFYMIDDDPFLGQVLAHVDVDYTVIARQDAPPAPPAAAFETDAYLVGATGSGVWAGEDNKIATYGAGAWAFTAVADGTVAYAETTDNYWVKDTTWSTTSNVTEANNGGAGNKSLRVVRKALVEVPGSAAVSGTIDLKNAAGAAIEYEQILPVGPSNSAHGYRVGDYVWVFRRGYYLFCLKAPKTFVGELQVGVKSDPSETLDDFATPHYWFREQVPTISYTGDSWTATWAAVSPTDPTGSGGRWGRWADALNLAETGSEHGLSDGTLVVITDVSDASSGEIGYVFDKANVPNIPTASLTTGSLIKWNGSGFVTVSGNTGDVAVRQSNGSWEPEAPSVALSVVLTGSVVAFAGDYDDPDVTVGTEKGWLFCDGTAISRATYAALFARIGVAYGAGSGGTTFNLPDTRARAWQGAAASEARLNATVRGYAKHGGGTTAADNNHDDHVGDEANGYEDGAENVPALMHIAGETHTETNNWPPNWIGPGIIKT